MSKTMKNRFALAAIAIGCVLGCHGANAQPTAATAYWVTETLEVKDQGVSGLDFRILGTS